MRPHDPGPPKAGSLVLSIATNYTPGLAGRALIILDELRPIEPGR